MTPDTLKGFGLLDALADEEREAIASLLEPRDLKPQQVLFAQGAESDGLVLVERGRLRVASERGARGGTLRAGDAIGGLSLIAIGTREVSVTALEPSRVLLLPRAAFHRLVDEAPRACVRLLEALLAETAGLVRSQLGALAPPTGGALDRPRSGA